MNDDTFTKLALSLPSLGEISKTATTLDDLEITYQSLLRLIMGTIGISRGAVLGFDENTNELHFHTLKGVQASDGLPSSFVLDDKDIEILLQHDDVHINLKEDSHPLHTLQSRNPEVFELLQSELWLPLIVSQKLYGLVSLSGKFIKDTYSENDLSLLMIMKRQIALAMHNYGLISDMQSVNARLNYFVEELKALHEVSQAISSQLDMSSVLDLITIKSQEVVRAEASSILLLDKTTNELYFQVAKGKISESLKPFRLKMGQGITGWVAQEGKPLAIDDVYSDSRFDPTIDKETGFKTKSILAVPMKRQDEVIGVVEVINKINGEPFNETDVELLSTLSGQAAVAIENARLHLEELERERMAKEIEVAASIMEKILPATLPSINNFDVAILNIPTHEIGGDYYDFLPVNSHSYFFTIADVTGKGTPAALLVSNLQASLHAYIKTGLPLGKIVTYVNEFLYQNTSSDRFISCFIGFLNTQTKILTSINAGHNYPLLYHTDGTYQTLEAGGMAIGVSDKEVFQEETYQLSDGDVLFLYTDGVTEAENSQEEFYDDARLHRILKSSLDKSAQEIQQIIYNDIQEFVQDAPQSDDMTMMVVKTLGN